MKICYLHQYFTTLDMPGGTRSFEMARRLVARGHEIDMITTDRRLGGHAPKGWHTTDESGIRVHWFPVPYSNEMPYPERIKAFLRFSFVAAIKSASIESDIIFATSTPLTIAIPAVYAARRRKVPMVFEVRDLWPDGPVAIGALKNPLAILAAKRLERFAYDNASKIITLSPGMKEGITEAGYPEDNIVVIPNGSDIGLFDVEPIKAQRLRKRYEWLQERPLVIYTGAIGLINGITYLVELAAHAYAQDREVRFLVVGTGREEEKVRQRATEIGVLNKNFFMIPEVPKKDIPLWLAAADIATSLIIDNEFIWINSANKFFDALAAGRPIAINHGGWQAELINKHGNGLVLDVHDARAASAMIIKAVNDREWLEKAGIASKQLAKKEFDRDLLAHRFEASLYEVVEEST